MTTVANPVDALREIRRQIAADNDVIAQEDVAAFNAMSVDDRLELLLHMVSAAMTSAPAMDDGVALQ